MRRLLLDARRILRAPSRNPRSAVVLGRLLAFAFLVCFGTGLYSHFLQQPLPWMVFATRPAWLYQLSQGIHITAGIACFPLILGKLHAVFPELFQTPPIRGFAHFLERASIAVFVAASLVQIATGLLNTYQWYPFPFPFKQVHFALSFVMIGSLAIHIAVKLPVIARYWTRTNSFDAEGNLVHDDEGSAAPEKAATGLTGRVLNWIDTAPPREPRVSRRGFVTTIGIATAAVVGLTAGQSFRALDGLNVFAPRKQGTGPNALPVNRTARAAQVTSDDVAAGWVLTVARGSTAKTFSLADLAALPQHRVDLPIACVEGWSQLASWRGVRLRDLMDSVGAHPNEDLRLTSLEKRGGYRVTEMGAEFVQDDLTLVALELNGDPLDLDHGYPARMIAPGRPGVLQTKWLSKLEVI
ncbi:molybdopterin-dependent oxidoreductase [Lacisediminihabitans profunda]|uniref:Molybdopterin-dependent oxidoreductase n=1 Tax=Lacisediminihabitans profunda TaxID=2594790 RepID=A0A5C8UTU0_9MICO|nr:molybdopterin-dependent oxidoreductase [Lacisediminihabitans profunda]TXN31049.1 molybdopterin-dependent oxidoreductase [Lacisediminihabitans profunda]